jgi:putative oxidoreductase
VRRLFSTFAHGWPGWGLLFLRLAAGAALITLGFAGLRTALTGGQAILDIVGIGAGLLLVVGLWTPVSAWVAAVLGLWRLFSQTGDPWADILLAAVGVALALVGPGALSVDARLYGWRRIDVGDR